MSPQAWASWTNGKQNHLFRTSINLLATTEEMPKIKLQKQMKDTPRLRRCHTRVNLNKQNMYSMYVGTYVGHESQPIGKA